MGVVGTTNNHTRIYRFCYGHIVSGLGLIMSGVYGGGGVGDRGAISTFMTGVPSSGPWR